MRRRKNNLFLVLILLLLGIGLGYALLSQDLTINGTTKVKGNNWSIYFDNIQITDGSVDLSTGDSDADLAENSDTVVEYIITLNQPGDFYEFTVDAVNDGTVDAMIGEVVSKLNNTVISTTNPVPSYLDYSVTYSDGIPIAVNHLLAANSTETYKVRVEFKRDIEETDLPTTDQTNSFSFGVSYVQADDSAQSVPHPVDFATDSWETVIGAIQSGNTSAYHVGDTKAVEVGNFGTHTLRIANMSTPDECLTEGFSQTACGFVLEFVDVVKTYTLLTTDVGGWLNSPIRDQINSPISVYSIYNSLPEILKGAILDTVVVSGHGSTSGETNFTTIDKLYLLSSHEVYEDVDGNTNAGIDMYDTAYYNTRQLDYYANLGVTSSNFAGASKQNSGSNYGWWLRSVQSNRTTQNTDLIERDGRKSNSLYSQNSSTLSGVSPAFRLGSVSVKARSFDGDSWSEIIENVQSNTIPSYYMVGSMKKIELGNDYGAHVVRIANASTPAECSTEGFSQTACGFVLEFADIITTHRMNLYTSGDSNLDGSTVNGTGNKGGWEYSDMRAYLNSTTYANENIDYSTTGIYSSLPEVLRNAVIDTTVVSGHGSVDTTNYTTTDKLYLLSSREVWNDTGSTDTAQGQTRQLDYYQAQRVTTSNYSRAIKVKNGLDSSWWLRSAYSNGTNGFYIVNVNGDGTWTGSSARYTNGVSPAFRIG